MAFKTPVKVKSTATLTTTESTAQEVYKIESDSADDNGAGALQVEGIPDIGDAFSTDYPYLLCKQVRADLMENSAWVYLVTVDYSDQQQTQGGGDPADPSTWDPEVELDGVEVTSDFNKDEDGNAVTNSAFDSFDPAPTRTYYDGLINVTIYRATQASETWDDYRGAVNNADFTITFPDGTTRTFLDGSLKIGKIRATYVRAKVSYWKVSFEIMYRKITTEFPNPWMRSFLDEGYYEIDGSGNKTRIKDSNGRDCVSPQLLDGLGHKLESGPGKVMPYRDYRLLPFGSLILTS